MILGEANERGEFVEGYVDAKGEYRWRHMFGNGRQFADSGEGFDNRSHCAEMARRQGAAFRVPIRWEPGFWSSNSAMDGPPDE